MAVSVAHYDEVDGGEVFKEVGFVALIHQGDGKLTTVKLEGAEVVQQREARELPAPTLLPGSGEALR